MAVSVRVGPGERKEFEVARRGFWYALVLVALFLMACSGAETAPSNPAQGRQASGHQARDRSVPLHGAPNFRDLGSYEIADGRTIRWGLVYRSDELAELDDADLAELERRELRAVVDLRSPEEVKAAPNRLPDTVTTHLHAQLSNSEMVSEDAKAALFSGKWDSKELRVRKLENYRNHVLGENRSCGCAPRPSWPCRRYCSLRPGTRCPPAARRAPRTGAGPRSGSGR